MCSLDGVEFVGVYPLCFCWVVEVLIPCVFELEYRAKEYKREDSKHDFEDSEEV